MGQAALKEKGKEEGGSRERGKDSGRLLFVGVQVERKISFEYIYIYIFLFCRSKVQERKREKENEEEVSRQAKSQEEP